MHAADSAASGVIGYACLWETIDQSGVGKFVFAERSGKKSALVLLRLDLDPIRTRQVEFGEPQRN